VGGEERPRQKENPSPLSKGIKDKVAGEIIPFFRAKGEEPTKEDTRGKEGETTLGVAHRKKKEKDIRG